MLKIKLNLFESVLGCILFPCGALFLNSIILVISLFVKQKREVYDTIALVYAISILTLIMLLMLCFIFIKKSKNEIIFNEDTFIFQDKTFYLKNISQTKYYVCKWYLLPLAFIAKSEQAGLIQIKMNNNEKIRFKVLYKDYKKIKRFIGSVEEI